MFIEDEDEMLVKVKVAAWLLHAVKTGCPLKTPEPVPPKLLSGAGVILKVTVPETFSLGLSSSGASSALASSTLISW